MKMKKHTYFTTKAREVSRKVFENTLEYSFWELYTQHCYSPESEMILHFTDTVTLRILVFRSEFIIQTYLEIILIF